MKLENLCFQNKKTVGGKYRVNTSYPNVYVSRVKSGHKNYRTRVSFRACDTLYLSNAYATYAIAGNRLYFMFCGDSKQAYKLVKSSKSSSVPCIIIQYNKEISKFIRDEEYTPKLDNECGLWYVEIN